MKDSTEQQGLAIESGPLLGGNQGFETGYTVEHVMLSVTIISTKGSAGQFDDSCSHVLIKGLKEYHGVERVLSEVLYKHTKIENHSNECTCGYCDPDGIRWAAYVKKRDAAPNATLAVPRADSANKP